MFGKPEWRKFKMGYGYVGQSNVGTMTAVMICMIGAGKTGGLVIQDVSASSACGTMIGEIEKAKVHSGKTSEWLLGQMCTGGPE